MADSAQTPEEARYIDFPAIPHGTMRNGKLVLNRWSAVLTKDHDFPGAQVRSMPVLLGSSTLCHETLDCIDRV